MRRRNKLLDGIDWEILEELQANARVSTAELGRRICLSLPAIVERIQKLLDHAAISGFHAHVEPSSVGLPVTAMIRMNTASDVLPRLSVFLRSLPEVVECYRETGTDSFTMKVCVESVEHLQQVIDRLTPFGMTSTSVVLSTIVAGRALDTTVQDWKVRLKAGCQKPNRK